MTTSPNIQLSTPVAAAVAAAIDNADNAGKFFPYHSNATPDGLAGFRTVVKTYKQSKAMAAKNLQARANVYVRIPTDHITIATVTDRIEELAPYIVSYLQGLEDSSIQRLHAERCTQVFIDTLTIGKILEDLEASGASGLNGEQITAWFTDSVASKLLEILQAKLALAGTSDGIGEVSTEQQARLQLIITSYLDTFISLASGKTMLQEAQRERLAKCLVLTGADSSILGAKFIARFAKMAERETTALASLGDLEL